MTMNVRGYYAAQSARDALAPFSFLRRDTRPDDVLKSDVKYRFVIDMASLKD